ncbi:MAG TPA: hypothetical protein DEB39_12080 [Planctomycetaceae bacterium]|nr:hypothetical protein [Planctomycetaceae bacterium]
MNPLLLKTVDAASFCGVTLRLWRTWNALGKNPAPVRIGKALFWNRDELVRWVEAGCPRREHWNALSRKKSRSTDSHGGKKE